MYTMEDHRRAQRHVKRCAFKTAAVLLPLAAAHVLGILWGFPGMMLAALIAGFVWVVLYGDMQLMPAVRYAAFLKDMNRGLRRSMECTLDKLDDDVQLQDGVYVRTVHVRSLENDDARIFYINISKANCLPALGGRVMITSFGRHIVACEGVET